MELRRLFASTQRDSPPTCPRTLAVIARGASNLSGKQKFQILASEIVEEAVVGGNDGIGQLAFGLLQLQHLLLNGAAAMRQMISDSTRSSLQY